MPYPCCCKTIVCPDQPLVIVVEITGVVNGGTCTTCSNLNDSFTITPGSIEFTADLCTGETVLDYCIWNNNFSVSLGCSGSIFPLLQFFFAETATDKYASLKFGNDSGNVVHAWWEKTVSSFGLPLTFVPANYKTASPCASGNGMCNWSGATISLSLP